MHLPPLSSAKAIFDIGAKFYQPLKKRRDRRNEERVLFVMVPGKTVTLEHIAKESKLLKEDALAALRNLQKKDRTVPINVDELPKETCGASFRTRRRYGS